MARYEEEFAGMPARARPPTGVDPNFRGGYGGMRMHGGYGRAAYGAHRMDHLHDLEGSGGYGGIHPGGPPQRWRGYDRDWHEMGGVRRFRDPHFLHEYNANSPALRRRGYGAEMEPVREPWPVQTWEHQGRYRPGYSNRGMSDGGYSEPWAHFPMRGGR